MTAESLLRPRVILPVLFVVLAAVLLLTPEVVGNAYEQRLSTHATSPGGGSGIYEVTSRLGWPVKRKETPITAPLDTNAVYAELGPVIPLSDADAAALLDAVRRGAGLIMVAADSGDPLSDSLHVRRNSTGHPVTIVPADTVGCGVDPTLPALSFGTYMWSLGSSNGHQLPGDTVTFIADEQLGPRPRPARQQPHLDPLSSAFTGEFIETTGMSSDGQQAVEHTVPAVLGLPLGRGRVLAVSDPDFLRNDVIRRCHRDIGVRMVRAIDWVSRGKRPPLIYDEYHQGFGDHADVFVASMHFLSATPLGHTILQALLGGLLLIIALGVRAIPPRAVRHIERRSPLEHVDALARAYEQIGATQTAVRRLVRGLRRRHDRGGAGVAGWSARSGSLTDAKAEPDERFLGGVAATHPDVSPAATLILAAERSTVPATELPAIAAAIDRIDDVFPHATVASTVHSS